MQITDKIFYRIEKHILPKNGRPRSVKLLLKTFINILPEKVRSGILKSENLRNAYEATAKRYRYYKGLVKPYKSARVFVRKGIKRMEFFSEMNRRKIDYVLLRWWHNLPEIPEGEDMDILIRDEHRDLIKDLVTYSDNGTANKCDIYTVTGSKYGSHKGIPYFQSNLAHDLLETRVLYRGAYVPSPRLYFASLAYHAVFHKGHTSGLEGFPKSKANIDIEHNYADYLIEPMQVLERKPELELKSLYKWLKDQNYAPAEDTLSKLVEIRPELSMIQERIYSDIRGGELIVYVIRERLLEDDLLQEFADFLEEEYQFRILDVRHLNEGEKEVCKKQIRGGKWDKGPFKYSGGPPAAFVIAFDDYPTPLLDSELKKQSRMTNRNNLLAKYAFRELINNKLARKKANYNGVHSSDNEQDAKFYISLLDGSYKEQILDEVEARRESFKGRWKLVNQES